jgi:hypothetical protein
LYDINVAKVNTLIRFVFQINFFMIFEFEINKAFVFDSSCVFLSNILHTRIFSTLKYLRTKGSQFVP